jgi:outer membrane protein assembly factor BamB
MGNSGASGSRFPSSNGFLEMNSLRSLVVIFGWVSMLAGGAAAAQAEPWPQFRGPRGDGHSTATGLPVTWSETENVRWKTPIHGKAWSSPVVWEGNIWLTTATEDGQRMYVVCVDAATGEIIHDVQLWEINKPQYCHPMNSYATPTPVVEAGRLYAHFGAHGTACVDTETGRVLWSRQDLPCDHHRGPASSPIVDGNRLILTFDGYDVQYLCALDKQTGETVWKTDRRIDYGTDNGDAKKAYSTPHVIVAGGRRQLISPSAGATIAYDPLSGEELWRVRSGGMNAAARPIFAHGLIYATTAAGGWQLFAVRPDGRGDVTGSHVAWRSGRGIPTRSSPVLVGDALFMVNDAGIMSCIDAITGDLVWQTRFGGKFSASPLYADGRIYFFSEEGVTPVIAAQREFKLLATNQLDDGFMASPAVDGQALILRTKSHLYRIEQ